MLNLNPKPVVGEAMAALGSDLSVALPFLLSLLGLRAGLMLQRRRSLLLQRREQQRSQQRLRQSPAPTRSRARQPAVSANANKRCNCSAPDAAIQSTIWLRKLELVAQALRDQQETPSRSAAVLFEPMRNHQGELKRCACAHWALRIPRIGALLETQSRPGDVPSGVRCDLGLQLDLPPALWGNPRTLQELIAILHNHNMPAALCTIGIEGSNASDDAIRQHLPLWRNAGFALSWLHAAGALDPAFWLHKQWVDEVQLFAPGCSHPTLNTPHQALIVTLIELAHARDLRVTLRGMQQQEDLQGLWQRGINLASGPPIGGPVQEISELLVKQAGNNQ